MKNRKLPFGYKLELGEIVCHPQEAELVQHIFQQYTAGNSYQVLVDELNDLGVFYVEGKQWNKNMIARILEDVRYVGEKEFPAIIQEEDLRSAAELRKAKQTPTRNTPAQKVIRQLSGQRVNNKLEEQILALLNDLIRKPEQISAQRQETYNLADHSKELIAALSEMPIEEERARELIFLCAMEQYRRIGSGEYETFQLQRVFTEAHSMERLDAELLRTTVASIQIDDSQVKLRLKNGQDITERRYI